MNVLLINPPNENELIANDPVIVKDQQGILPPLGILYIAAYLKRTGRYNVSVMDCQATKMGYDEMTVKIHELNPDVVGMSVMTFTLIDTFKTVKAIRIASDAKIVLGGSHPTIYPEETLKAFEPDYVVCGEGELIFDELLQAIPSDKKIWKQKTFIESLDDLPFPARELTDISKYYSVLAKSNPTTTMFSSRGCPFQCSYCDRPALGKRFRAMSAKRTVDEMEHCSDLGIKEIFFYDDTFTINKMRVLEICLLIKQRALKIAWDVRSRVDTIDEEMIKVMKEAGCVRIHFGVESSQEHVLKALNKGIHRQQVEEAFRLCKKYGVKCLAYFMIGNPFETLYDICQTIKLAKNLNPDYMHCTILIPFPATKLYEKALTLGIIPKDVWREYSLHPTTDFKPPMWGSFYSRSQLQGILQSFYKSFYLKPSRIFEMVMEIRNFKQFVRYLKAGLSLLKMSL